MIFLFVFFVLIRTVLTVELTGHLFVQTLETSCLHFPVRRPLVTL